MVLLEQRIWYDSVLKLDLKKMTDSPQLPARRPALDDLNPLHAWLVERLEAISPTKNEVTAYIEALRTSIGRAQKLELLSPYQGGGSRDLINKKHRDTAVVEDRNAWLNKPSAVRGRFLNCLAEAVRNAPLGEIAINVKAAATKFIEDDYRISGQDEDDLYFINQMAELTDMNGSLHDMRLFVLALLAVTNVLPVRKKLDKGKK